RYGVRKKPTSRVAANASQLVTAPTKSRRATGDLKLASAMGGRVARRRVSGPPEPGGWTAVQAVTRPLRPAHKSHSPSVVIKGRLTAPILRARTIMSKFRRLLWGLPVAGALAAGGLFLAQKGVSAPEKGNGDHADAAKPADLKPAVSLPISQVILFN